MTVADKHRTAAPAGQQAGQPAPGRSARLGQDVEGLGHLLEQLGLAQIALSNVLRLYFGETPVLSDADTQQLRDDHLEQVSSTLSTLINAGETCALAIRERAALVRGALPQAMASGAHN